MQEEARRNAYRKLILVKLLVNSILIIEAVKYLIIEVPQTEKFLIKEVYDSFYIKILKIMFVS